MANYRINKIKIGQDFYELSGWYGNCTTSVNSNTKTVNISSFTSAQLVNGCRITVRFEYGQIATPPIYLNVSSTGSKIIKTGTAEDAGMNEWSAGQIVSFVYYNGTWFIEDGAHASTSAVGKTRLTNLISLDEDRALTPNAVYRAGFVDSSGMTSLTWNGANNDSATILSVTTPTADQWTTTENLKKQYTVPWTDNIDSAFNAAYDLSHEKATVTKITYGDNVYYIPLYGDMMTAIDVHDGDIAIYGYDYGFFVVDSAEGAGVHTLEWEVIYGDLYVTHPTLKQYLKDSGYLTLADLPVWDGSVT